MTLTVDDMKYYISLIALLFLSGCWYHHEPEYTQEAKSVDILLYDTDLGIPVATFTLHQTLFKLDGEAYDSVISMEARNTTNKYISANFNFYWSAPGAYGNYFGSLDMLRPGERVYFGYITEQVFSITSAHFSLVAPDGIYYTNTSSG